MNRWAIIVTGSRRLGYSKLKAVLDVLAEYADAEHVIVIHGAQRGADDLARDAAAELGYDSIGIPYFGDLGVRGGPARNRCIVDVGVTLRSHGYKLRAHGFPDSESRGTYDCLDYARTKDVDCQVHPQ